MSSEIKTGSSSYVLSYGLRVPIIKREFDDLLEEMEEVMQQAQKIFQELTALLSSGTPPSPQQVAVLLGKMELLIEESNRLREQTDGLATKMEFAGFIDTLRKNLGTSQDLTDLKRQLSEKIADRPKQLELSQLSSQVSKDGLKAIEELAQMTVAKGSMNEADVEQLLQTLSQLSDSISKAREALRES